MRSLFLAAVLSGAALLAGCANLPTPGATQAAVTATVSKAQADVQMAIDLYGVAKGMAGAASLVNPAAGAALNAAVAVMDPIVAKAQFALNAATVDATALEALATQIKTQANALTLAAAPAVTVIPAGITTPPAAG